METDPNKHLEKVLERITEWHKNGEIKAIVMNVTRDMEAAKGDSFLGESMMWGEKEEDVKEAFCALVESSPW